VESPPESHVTPTALPGVFLIERPVYPDDRGFFHEIERRAVDVDASAGCEVLHAQWSHSLVEPGSAARHPRGAVGTKCVYVARGLAQAAIVDARLPVADVRASILR